MVGKGHYESQKALIRIETQLDTNADKLQLSASKVSLRSPSVAICDSPILLINFRQKG